MKKNNRFFSLFISISFCLLLSCNSDHESISDKKLLPSQITQNYGLVSSSPGTSIKVIDKYIYDDNNRLENISQTYAITSPDGKTTNTKSTVIKYDAEGRVSEAYITSSENSAVGIVSIEEYTYDGDKITINKDGKDVTSIQVLEKSILLTDLITGEAKSTTDYQLDNNGNVVQYTHLSDYKDQRRYNHDPKNGIFKQVNTSGWFLVTQIGFSGYQYENRTKEFVLSDNKWIEITYNELQYNKDDYPIFIKTNPSPDWVGISSSTMAIEYIQAKTIAQNGQ